MSSINTNLSAMTALQSLKATQTSLIKTQGQISTGLRVGEASHNASYWSIATQMKSDNGALGAVKDAIKQSKAMINTNTSAMDKTLTYLNKMKEGLVAASQPGADLAKIQTEFKAHIEGMKSAANSASFNGQNWLSGAGGTVNLVTSYDGANNTVNTLAIDTSKTVLFTDPSAGTGGLLADVAKISLATTVTGTETAGEAAVTGSKGTAAFLSSAVGLADGDVLSVNVDGGTAVEVTVGASETIDTLVSKFNTAATTAGVGVVASKDGTGADEKLVFTSANNGENVAATYDGVASTDTAAGVDASAGAKGTAEMLTSAVSLAEGAKLSVSVDGGTAIEVDVAADDTIDTLITKFNTEAAGAVVASKTGTGADEKLVFTSANVGEDVSATFGGSEIAQALKDVDAAIAKVTEGSAMLGANKNLLETQEEFISALSDSLTAGVSAFVDADMNEASTRLQALQTQQQLGVQALSIANQNSQMILKLFQ